jgi:dihydroneopterin aldolase
MTDKILVDGVRFWGRHGVTDAEQAVGGWFSVDAELAVDLRAAALSDELAATIDYGRVVQRIVETGTAIRARLIERVAGAIAEALLREFPAEQVTVRVRKLTAPLGGHTGTPGVELTRRR